MHSPPFMIENYTNGGMVRGPRFIIILLLVLHFSIVNNSLFKTIPILIFELRIVYPPTTPTFKENYIYFYIF